MYYSSFSMDVKGVKDEKTFHALEKAIRKKDLFQYVFDFPRWEEDDILHFYSYDECGWVRHFKDMTELASAFPGLTFCLHAHGEDFDGCWDEYFHNKTYELCKAVIPPPKTIEW